MRRAEWVLVLLILAAGVGIWMLAANAPAAPGAPGLNANASNASGETPRVPPAPIGPPALEPQCAAGASRNCTLEGCPGSQACLSGVWADCRPRVRICMPGQRVSCSTSDCSFGLAQCDACGTGWLDCKPPSDYN